MIPARTVLSLPPAAPREERDAVRAALDAFLDDTDPVRRIARWAGSAWFSALPAGAMQTGAMRTGALRARLSALLSADIARIDEMLSEQLDAILHHPRLRRLEATWRGLLHLVEQAERFREGEGPGIRIRVLDVSWDDLARDLERAIEFDQSHLFKKVYEAEFGTAGGEPFGLLLGDYEISHRPRKGRATNDLATLTAVSHVAAAAFAPFVAAADPALLGLDDFGDLELPLDLAKTFDQAEYVKWKAFRSSQDARFVGLVLPRVLARKPWREGEGRADLFPYREDASAPDGSGMVFGTAVYAFGGVVARAFGESSWPADIRGVPAAGEGGGLVTGLPVWDMATDAEGVAPRIATDVLVTDRLEMELGDLGFMTLCHLPGTTRAAFYGNPSVQAPQVYDDAAATINARLSSMIQYMLSVSRFAHFLKTIGRNKIGSYASPDACQRDLHEWLMSYSISNDEASHEMKARYPLRDAKVEVRDHPARPGHYVCVVHLQPHFQLDQVVSGVRLVTEFAPVRAG